MVILKSFFIASLFSSSLYLEHFELTNIFFNSVISILSIFIILIIRKKELFITGFFIGILWFYWLAFSFKYYDLNYLIPIIILSIGLFYGILFYLIGVLKHPLLKALGLFILTFITPFGFNWFKPELIFINTIFDTSIISYFIILFSIALMIRYRSIFPIFLLLFSVNYNDQFIEKPDLKIYTPQYNISQDDKWKISYRKALTDQNIQNIDYAIANKYDLIILPETAFPLPLNNNKEILNILKEKSQDISIVSGALDKSDDLYYNATYLFEKGGMTIAHKSVLVPFGEAVPLPQKIRDFINKQFYNGAKDYAVAKHPTTFNIQGFNFRNAICYEATTDKIFENLDAKYLIVTSNNAWFTPSIEPTLQNLLLKYYAKKYNVIIYHSSNMSKNTIIQ